MVPVVRSTLASPLPLFSATNCRISRTRGGWRSKGQFAGVVDAEPPLVFAVPAEAPRSSENGYGLLITDVDVSRELAVNDADGVRLPLRGWTRLFFRRTATLGPSC